MSLTVHLTPQGHARLTDDANAPALDAAVAARLGTAFERGEGPGLLHLGAAEVETPLTLALAYWRDFAARYVTAAAGSPAASGQGAKLAEIPPPSNDTLDAIVRALPPMVGIEYLTADVLSRLWHELDAALRAELARVAAVASGVPARAPSRLERRRPRALQPGGVPSSIRRRRSRFSRPTRRRCPRAARRSTRRSAARCRSTRARATSRGCCRCSCRCSVPLNRAPG